MPLNDKETVGNLLLIIARKVDYVHALLLSLKDPLRGLSGDEESVLRRTLVRAIGGMDAKYFISGEERRAGRLKLGTELELLDREAIWAELERELNLA